jgi:hypothetical protein
MPRAHVADGPGRTTMRSPKRRVAQTFAQLLVAQPSELALAEILEIDPAHTQPLEGDDAGADGVEHAPYLAVLAFAKADADH